MCKFHHPQYALMLAEALRADALFATKAGRSGNVALVAEVTLE